MNFDSKDDFISQHMPFIIKTVADYTNKYVEIENSEELSIALEAFYYAMDKYEDNKGAFFPFAKKVIINKLIDEFRKRNKVITLQLEEKEIATYEHFEEDTIFKNEIYSYESLLKEYGIDFDKLSKTAPKHMQTRMNLFEIGKELSEQEDIVDFLRKNKRIPITEISNRFNISKKVLKTHKSMIIAIIVAYINNISTIIQWIDNK